MPFGEQADAEHAPRAAHAVHRDGADRIVDLERLIDEQRRDDDEDARDGADDRPQRPALTNAQGAVIATSPASSPLQIIVTSGLP